MLLAVDIGNSNIKFGVFDGETLLSKRSFPTRKFLSSVEPASLNMPEGISACIASSVVPEADDKIARTVREMTGVELTALFADALTYRDWVFAVQLQRGMLPRAPATPVTPGATDGRTPQSSSSAARQPS